MVVAGPFSAPELPLELLKVAAASAGPVNPEFVPDSEDCTCDPLILKMYAMMSSWDNRKKLEGRDYQADKEKTLRSSFCQSTVTAN